jgi:glycosyltransferase involved in cell wall biosynthesis
LHPLGTDGKVTRDVVARCNCTDEFTPSAAALINGAPRLLFLPVSGPAGMGETVRSMQIAYAALRRWPDAKPHFALSRVAPLAVDFPFDCTLLPASPTFHSAEVNQLIALLKPDVVIFDNSGRTRQLRAARAAGARIVYISSRPRQRRKAFRWRWRQMIDEHWIAYPRFLAGSLSWLERFKLRLRPQSAVRYLDVILPAPTPQAEARAAQRLGAATAPFALFVAGGVTNHPHAIDAVGIFAAAAKRCAALGHRTVLIDAGEQAAAADARLVALPRLPADELIALLRRAQVVVTNGGATLLQAMASGAACIAVPIAGDQPERIRRCVRAGVALAAPLAENAMVAQAAELLDNAAQRATLVEGCQRLKLADGLAIAVQGLECLLRDRSGS